MIDPTQREYYNRRAQEYERIYAKPERQNDIARVRADLKERFRGRRVLEVCCGTGFWTEAFCNEAQSVLASDQSAETLEIARAKNLPRTLFIQDDAYRLTQTAGDFDAAFAGFWWSHIPKTRRDEFLRALTAHLEPGSRVVLIDNHFVEGSNTPLSRTDDDGNTYQVRTLGDGSQYEILKNFPTDEELRAVLGAYSGTAVTVQRQSYFWLAEFSTVRKIS